MTVFGGACIIDSTAQLQHEVRRYPVALAELLSRCAFNTGTMMRLQCLLSYEFYLDKQVLT